MAGGISLELSARCAGGGNGRSPRAGQDDEMTASDPGATAHTRAQGELDVTRVSSLTGTLCPQPSKAPLGCAALRSRNPRPGGRGRRSRAGGAEGHRRGYRQAPRERDTSPLSPEAAHAERDEQLVRQSRGRAPPGVTGGKGLAALDTG